MSLNVIQWYNNRQVVAAKAKQDAQQAKLDAKTRDEEAATLDQKYTKALAQVIFFPGTIQEYEQLRGYEPGTIVPCDTGCRDKGFLIRQGVYLNRSFVDNYVGKENVKLRNKLIDEGLEALIHAKSVSYGSDRYCADYGLPVKKLK